VISYSIYLWQQPFTHLRLTSSFFLPEQLTLLGTPLIGVMCILDCSLFSYFVIDAMVPFMLPTVRLRIFGRYWLQRSSLHTR
jgi:hypothetical protein